MIELIGIKKAYLPISNEDRIKFLTDIKTLFEKENWCKDVPHHQTYPTLFETDDTAWTNLKYKVIDCIKSILKVETKNILCWSYVTFANSNINNKWLWHKHSGIRGHDANFSAILYLQTNNEFDGTVFDAGSCLIIPKVEYNQLYIFPSDTLHSPPPWSKLNSNVDRFTLAFDIWV